jgi:hypothetical protein
MKLISTLACALFTNFLSAQQTVPGPLLQSLVKLDLGMRGVGFSYEPTLGNRVAIDLSAGLGGGYYVADNYFEYRWILLDPAFYLVVNPRWYYSRLKRLKKGKNMMGNAGNYIGLAIKYASSTIGGSPDISDALLFNLHWGIQRSMGNSWVFNTHFGLGYAIDAADLNKSPGSFYPAFDVRFAYLMNHRKLAKK